MLTLCSSLSPDLRAWFALSREARARERLCPRRAPGVLVPAGRGPSAKTKHTMAEEKPEQDQNQKKGYSVCFPICHNKVRS